MSAEVGSWSAKAEEIHRRAANAYFPGCVDAGRVVSAEDAAFLKSIGIPLQMVLDYVEDFTRGGEPDLETFVSVVGIRREYFLDELRGVWPDREVPERDLPLKSEELDGIAWLPRIIRKAGCFLDGTLCREVMYGCSGDRGFLKRHGSDLPGFLKLVRDHRANDAAIVRHMRGL